MKKTLAFMLMLLAIGYGISAQATSSKDGVIKELTGQVEFKATGKTVFTAARAGDKITQDTIISTGFKKIGRASCRERV